MNPWKSVSSPPPTDTVVVIARYSGYTSAQWEYMSAIYDPEYRPKSPWLTLGRDAVTDSGREPMYWRMPPTAPNAPDYMFSSESTDRKASLVDLNW